MNYPLISEYIEAIKSAEDNFNELTNLRPVLDDDGQPVMTSGNFAVVFKMQDVKTGKIYALKCFTKEQEGRTEAYHQIADALKDVDSPYLISIHYLDKELFVDTSQTDETEFPVLLMDWVEGKTLDKYLRENLDNKYALEMLAYRFSQLAQWLIPQPFAHGDLKPDNILVREDGTLVLVDYDGMYVPAMKGQKARELGSPDFRHPLRTEDGFDGHIDDFPIISILFSLKAISYNPLLLENYGGVDRLLFCESDYRDIHHCIVLKDIPESFDKELNKCKYIFRSFFYKELPAYSLCDIIFEEPSVYVNKVTSITNEEWDNRIVEGNNFGNKSFSKDKKKILRFEDYVVFVGDDASFSECRIDEKINTICDKAFQDCRYLRFVSIPPSVKYIGEKAFSGCFFTYIELPINLEYISKNAFDNCPRLKTIVIPHGTYQKYSVLLPENISQLHEIDRKKVKSIIQNYLENEKRKGNTYWETMCTLFNQICYLVRDINLFFDCCGLYGTIDNCGSEYIISNIGDVNEIVNAIYNILLDLRAIDIFDRNYDIIIEHDNRIEINGICYAKRNGDDEEEDEDGILSTEVTKADLANAWIDEYGVKYSADRVRLLDGYNVTIKEYEIKEGTKVICDGAFSRENMLEYISIPQSVASLGFSAFSGCVNLKEIIIPSSILYVNGNPFCGLRCKIICLSNRFKVVMTENSVGDLFYSLYTSDMKTIIHCGHSDVIWYDSNSGSGYDCDPYPELDMAFAIPNSVETIKSGAFASADLHQTIIIPDTVKIIEKFAFWECPLESIILPDKVDIDAETFKPQNYRYNSFVKSINVPGESVCYYCSKLPYDLYRIFELPPF